MSSNAGVTEIEVPSTVTSTTDGSEVEPASQGTWECDLRNLMSGVDEIVNGVLRTGAPAAQLKDDVWGATLVYSTIVSSTASSLGDTEFVFLERAEYPDGDIDYKSFAPQTFFDDHETIVLAETFETQEWTQSRVLNLVRIDDNGVPRFADGPCAGLLAQDLGAMSAYLGVPAQQLLLDWVASPVDPKTGETAYASVLEEVRQQGSDESYSAAWGSTDPGLRSLSPGDVPELIRATLDVRAIQLAVDIPDDLVLVVRTTSGVSGAVAGNVLPTVQPAYFTPGDEVVEILLAKDVADLEGQVIARIPAQDLRDQAGAVVGGSIDSPSVSILNSEQLVEILGLESTDDLERLRLSLLAPPTTE